MEPHPVPPSPDGQPRNSLSDETVTQVIKAGSSRRDGALWLTRLSRQSSKPDLS